jgi:hypothetical protein
MWKNIVEQGRPQMIIQHGACALHAGYLRLKTHLQYVILIAFPLQQMFQERASFKALLLSHNDAHNHKMTGILKQLKIPTVAPTYFVSRRNHRQGAIFVLS